MRHGTQAHRVPFATIGFAVVVGTLALLIIAVLLLLVSVEPAY